MSISVYDPITKKLTQIAGNSNPIAFSIDELKDINISSPTDGQVLMYDSTSGAWVNANGETPIIQSATLSSGSTSVTFNGLPTSGDYLINFYTSTGINYKAIDTATAGQVTLTFDAQSSAVTVYCEIKEV